MKSTDADIQPKYATFGMQPQTSQIPLDITRALCINVFLFVCGALTCEMNAFSGFLLLSFFVSTICNHSESSNITIPAGHRLMLPCEALKEANATNAALLVICWYRSERLIACNSNRSESARKQYKFVQQSELVVEEIQTCAAFSQRFLVSFDAGTLCIDAASVNDSDREFECRVSRLSQSVSIGESSYRLVVQDCRGSNGNPCLNGGLCHLMHPDTPVATVECFCPTGWSGAKCEIGQKQYTLRLWLRIRLGTDCRLWIRSRISDRDCNRHCGCSCSLWFCIYSLQVIINSLI